MHMVLNKEWLMDMESRILQSREVNEVLSNSISQKALVVLLAKYGVPFKVIPLGVGVKRITTQVDLCTKCNGTGKC